MSQGSSNPKVTFYIGTHHKDFRKKLKNHLSNLDKMNIDYVIFERDDKLLPTLCTNGECVAGLHNIKKSLTGLYSI